MAAMVAWRKAGRCARRKSVIDFSEANVQGAMKKCGKSLTNPLWTMMDGARTESSLLMADFKKVIYVTGVRPAVTVSQGTWLPEETVVFEKGSSNAS